MSKGSVTGSYAATAIPEDKTKPNKNRHLKSGGRILSEFCCDQNSAFGEVGPEIGVSVVQVCRESIDLSDASAIEQLYEQVQCIPGCAIHGSSECRPWSQWQRPTRKKHPRLCEVIGRQQKDSEETIISFVRIADIVLDQGGDASFEWPRYWNGLNNSVLLDWIIRRQLRSNVFPGCAVGVTAKDGLSARNLGV